jgi:Xaa-Pro aminopeptidase
MKTKTTVHIASIYTMVSRIILGVDIHDLGERYEPLQEGMLLTVEPGIYIEEEQMGIRIENNIWIRREGNVDLMKNIPIEADEIEALMKK